MAYFTTVLQRQVDQVWRRKIEDADARMQLYARGKEVRDYLNDPTTLCTTGYVIRRHLQKHYTDLLDQVARLCGESYADLTGSLNVPWPENFNQALARELHLISKKQEIAISRTTWMAYLDDAPVKMYKDTPFKVAYSLYMDTETTEELLMACGQDTYCFRNPSHFIYYYCQNRPTAYSWKHAQALLNRYQAALASRTYTAADASVGMTFQLQGNLKQLFINPAPEAQADEDLLAYMLANQKEFSGLSLSTRADFLRMAAYLAVLYPTYTKVIKRRNPRTGLSEDISTDVALTLLPDGSPRLNDLVRALFNTGGWLPTTVGKSSPGEPGSYSPSGNFNSLDGRSLAGTDGRFHGSTAAKQVRTASSLKRRASAANIEYRRAPLNEEKDRPFLNSIQYFVDSYSHHLDAIDRIYRRPSNPGHVERRDVILFTYFFIRRYPELLEDEDQYGHELDQLTQLAYGDTSLDQTMDALMEALYDFSFQKQEAKDARRESPRGNMPDCPNDESKASAYIRLFNLVLQHFGMKPMYMPNPWDRFLTMSLFAEDPDFFTEAVLWNTIEEEEEAEAGEAEETGRTEGTERAGAGAGATGKTGGTGTTRRIGQAATAVRICVSDPLAPPSLLLPGKMPTYLYASLRRDQTGEQVTINKTRFVFGRRSKRQDLFFQDYGFPTDRKTISRCHAAILFLKGTFYLADISGRRETWLNGTHLLTSDPEAIAAQPSRADYAYPLKDRDQIRLGNELFTFFQRD